jgi:hypothetical protein
VILRQIAHARAGDKGDRLILSVIAHRAEDYPLLAERLTAERVAERFAPLVRGTVTRREAPGLAALVFTLDGALGGGVSTSLAIDPHGKSFSALLMGMEL